MGMFAKAGIIGTTGGASRRPYGKKISIRCFSNVRYKAKFSALRLRGCRRGCEKRSFARVAVMEIF